MTAEVKEALETVMLEDIESIRDMKIDDDGRKEAVRNIVAMAEVVNTADQIDEKWVDNNERRKLEEMKAKEANEVELKKSKLTPGKVALECAKLLVPFAVTVPLYLYCHADIMNFEKTGKRLSEMSRKTNLPKVFKF